MFLFAHVGITVGAAVAVQAAAMRRAAADQSDAGPDIQEGVASAVSQRGFSGVVMALCRTVDLRIVALGAMFPDIIDKPLGALHVGDGRAIAHTLLFSLVLLCLGLWLLKKHRSNAVLVIALGSLLHLGLDSMWRTPATLLWPSQGWVFPTGTPDEWLRIWLHSLFHNPAVFLPETTGLVIIIVVSAILQRNGALLRMLRRGRLKPAD